MVTVFQVLGKALDRIAGYIRHVHADRGESSHTHLLSIVNDERVARFKQVLVHVR
jgi:hypothetical protein